MEFNYTPSILFSANDLSKSLLDEVTNLDYSSSYSFLPHKINIEVTQGEHIINVPYSLDLSVLPV